MFQEEAKDEKTEEKNNAMNALKQLFAQKVTGGGVSQSAEPGGRLQR